MEKNVLKGFFEKVITSQSITEDMRKEALELRDTLILVGNKKKVAVIDVFNNGQLIAFKGIDYVLSDLEECASRAMNEGLGKIAFIKEIRSMFGIGLKDAKEFSELLAVKGYFTYR